MELSRRVRSIRRKFVCGDDGAVSVYLIVATAGMLLLSTLLIDYARVAAFRKQVELAAQSGIRSALSAYDGMLYERYGLFGTGGTSRAEIFSRVAQNNWMPKTGKFRYLQIAYGSSHVNGYEVLGTHEVFKRQVLEEMKYKAPIDFTLEVASRFAPISSAMKEASAAVELLGQIRKLYDQREAHLETVLQLQREAAGAAQDGIPELIPVQLHQAVSGSTALSVAAGYGSYLGWIEHDASLEADEESRYSNEISSYEQSARTVSGDLRRNSRNTLLRHQALERRAARELEEAKRFNTEMQRYAQQMLREQANTGYDRVSGSRQITGGSAGSAVSTGDLSQVRQSREAVLQLILPPEWFDAYREELSRQTVDFASFDTEAAGFQSGVTAALSGRGSPVLLAEGAAQLRLAYEQYAEKYIRPASVIEARAAQMRERQSSDADRRKKESAAAAKWQQLRGFLHGLTGVPQLDEHREAFEQVRLKYEANLNFNRLSDAADPVLEVEAEPADQTAQSMRAMGTIFSGMADMLDGIRDPLYLNEYIVHRYNAFDPQKFQAMLQNGDPNEFTHALSFNNQEVEYVLFGFHDPAANVAAAYGEILAFRLAVRTMEGLIESGRLGNPLLVLAGAVLYGLEKAAEDMVSLARTGATPLSKYTPVDVRYIDYLRVFLLLHPGSGSRIARMIAAIEQNTGAALSRTATGLTGELTASVNLWFLPGLMRTLTQTGLLNGSVKGSRYEMTHTAGWSYG